MKYKELDALFLMFLVRDGKHSDIMFRKKKKKTQKIQEIFELKIDSSQASFNIESATFSIV